MPSGVTSQTFTIACVCTGPFTLTTTPSSAALQYSTISGTDRNFVTAGGYTTTLKLNQYYYFIPNGGSYGNNTKCLKVKWMAWSINPLCTYNPTTNSWSGLGTTASYEITEVNKSVTPSCLPC